MNKIKLIPCFFILTISVLWFGTGVKLPEPFMYYGLRDLANQYSGIIAMGAMSLCMWLAIRPKWLETFFNGLDKTYRLHKWLGITALVATLTHYWFTQGSRWLVSLGIVTKPVKKKPVIDPNAPFDFEVWLKSFKGIAEDVGEWAFYLALVLMVVALAKRIPYHWFKKTHKLLAVSYLALVFHAVVLIKFPYWSQPVGWVMALLMLMGSYSAFVVLFKGIGKEKRYVGKIVAIQPLTAMNSYSVTIEVPQWQGHQAGQFAFIQADKETHPFTIASSWNADKPYLRFVIKQLGDYTNNLAQHFAVGKSIEITGPYGKFTFEDKASEQIWIGSGVGITPFMAGLEQRIASQATSKVALYYCYRESDAEFIEQLKQTAQQANVVLHLWNSQTQGHLTAETIVANVADIKNATVWFCGNTAFATQLKLDLSLLGFNKNKFHQELFEMR